MQVPLGVPVEIDGVRVWYFRSKSFRRLYYSSPMKKALLDRIKEFDLLHLHSTFLWPTWAAARAAHQFHIPYLITPRGTLVKELIRRKNRWLKSAWILLIEKQNLRHAAAIHFTSKLEEVKAKQLGLSFPNEFVVANGIDENILDEFKKEDVSPRIQDLFKKKPLLLFLGRVNWEKGLDRLVSALPLVPEVHLVIAGNDEENYQSVLEKLAERNHVRNRISFTGTVQGADKAALLKNAAALILPSYSENFGIVVLEAMAACCPVVVTPEVGLAEVVRETGAGLVVEGEPKVMGKSIRTLLSNSETLTRMGKIGRQTLSNRFTWDTIARQMASVYKQILNNFSRGR